MLNRTKLYAQIELVAQDIFLDTSKEREQLMLLWRELCADPLLSYKLSGASVSWSLPTWQEAIDSFVSVKPVPRPYDLLSVDGSQIYPDRHSGISCYLINIGKVALRYEHENPVLFETEPFVFSGNSEQDIQLSTDLINGKRQDLEFCLGYDLAKKLMSDRDQLLLFDGSLVFWHLEAKDPMLKEMFLSRYLHTLLQLAREGIIFASYISSPKSREIMNVVRTYGCGFDEAHIERVASLSGFTDDFLMATLLEPGQRTIVFKNHAKVSELYQDLIHPYFFYIHVGSEIGRVELPAYLALDQEMVDWIAAVVYDQCKKGMGYPVALAEAHEQAVVKGADREFFYQILTKMSIERNRQLTSSTKLLRKRGMGV